METAVRKVITGRYRHTAASLCFVLVLALSATAATVTSTSGQAPARRTLSDNQPIPPETLDRTISETISQPGYRWRLPRETEQVKKTASQNTFLLMAQNTIEDLFARISKYMRKFLDWLDRYFRNKEHSDKPEKYTDWQSSIRSLIFILIAVTVSALAITLLRIWKNKKAEKKAVAVPVAVTPDIADENVTADQLPSDEWMNMASDLLGRGEFRLALRAMFLAALVNLSYREKLTIAKYKSNREYLAELERRAHDRPDLLAAFSTNVRVLESIWYGTHAATQEIVTAFTSNVDLIFERSKEQQNTVHVQNNP